LSFIGRGFDVRIGAPGAAVDAWVIATDEERMLARQTPALIEDPRA
jgi:acetate kinase